MEGFSLDANFCDRVFCALGHGIIPVWHPKHSNRHSTRKNGKMRTIKMIYTDIDKNLYQGTRRESKRRLIISEISAPYVGGC